MMARDGHSRAALRRTHIDQTLTHLAASGDLARLPGGTVRVLAAVLALGDLPSGSLPDVPTLCAAVNLTPTQVERALAGLTRHGYLPLGQAGEGER